MNWQFWRRPKIETRSSGTGYIAQIIAARDSYVSGRTGIGELTATAQSCITLCEGGLSLADVTGTDILTPAVLGMTARALALRGEAVFLIGGDRLIPCSDWDVRTRDGVPTAYRVSISDAGGGTTRTALAPEVFHFRLAADPLTPWAGTPPLRRSSLTAGMLVAVGDSLREVYETAPLGSQIVPFPESADTDMEKIGRGFRGQRGRVMLRESVAVTATGGPTPQTDWKPQDVTPDLSRSMAVKTLDRARSAVAMAFGVLPGMFITSATGPLIREGQRHLAQ